MIVQNRPRIRILKATRSSSGAAVMTNDGLHIAFSGNAGYTKAKAYARIMNEGLTHDNMIKAADAGMTMKQCIPAIQFFRAHNLFI